MRFDVFGIPTEIHFSFWLMSVMFGLAGTNNNPLLIAIWVGVVFISILVHELGHAFAMRRYGIEPSISLYSLGGLTRGSAAGMGRLTRGQRIFVSFAGPLAGFVLGGLTFGVHSLLPEIASPGTAQALGYLYSSMLWVNIGWGLVNLIPVLPLDGGHIILELFGPKRERTASICSMVIGIAVAVWALKSGMWWIGAIFGFGAYHSFQRLQNTPQVGSSTRARADVEDDPPSERTAGLLAEASRLMARDEYLKAKALAHQVLADTKHEAATRSALHVIGWSNLHLGDGEEALKACDELRKHGMIDASLLGATLVAMDRFDEAKIVLEAARAEGDDRKTTVGPLIQCYLHDGNVPRAAATALDIVDHLSDDDVTTMAEMANDAEAHSWASRLYEAVFDRTQHPDHGYSAARHRALEGDLAAGLLLLEKAVDAGFSDRSRAWTDDAWNSVREHDLFLSRLPEPQKS